MENAARATVGARIAARVLALRTERGLTLAALAERSGVSRSMLSLIERGEASPTAVVLDRVASALDVALAVLFDAPERSPDPVSRGRERATWRDPDSAYERRAVTPPGVAAPFRIVDVRLPAGATVAYETGGPPHAPHQQVWVQEGRIEVTVGGHRYDLHADDCLAMRLDAPVRFRNPGRRAARYVVVVSAGPLGG